MTIIFRLTTLHSPGTAPDIPQDTLRHSYPCSATHFMHMLLSVLLVHHKRQGIFYKRVHSDLISSNFMPVVT